MPTLLMSASQEIYIGYHIKLLELAVGYNLQYAFGNGLLGRRQVNPVAF
jgi:hypothetical protein